MENVHILLVAEKQNNNIKQKQKLDFKLLSHKAFAHASGTGPQFLFFLPAELHRGLMFQMLKKKKQIKH